MKQIALLIGNNSYPEETLKNAAHDADALAQKLEELGFVCTVATDASAVKMDKALGTFGEKLKEHEVGVFFFAGHGMQIDGENYLTAIDTNFESERDAKHSSLPLNKVIETMEAAGNRTSILILDACRTNPYERRWRSSAPRGLAPVYAPKGMIIAYATSPGQVAYDGLGANGAYTHAILTHIAHQNLSIESFFKRVRNTLSSSTSGKQISWEHTSLMGDYFFNLATAKATGVTGYSEAAIADKDYGPLRGRIGEIIEGLKSSDWYRQNPAMAKITADHLGDGTKDECFVLGRNIYQAACGTAKSATAFVEDLRRSLGSLPGNVGFHLLNGMLFEIYFDSRGLRRRKVKAEYLDEVFALEEDTAHADSFQFIQRRLQPYRDLLFYFPGSPGEVCLDVVIGRFNSKPAVTKICYEAENVLYNAEGDGYFELDDEVSLEDDTVESFRTKLSHAMAVPSFRLKISYVGRSVSGERFKGPWRPNLQRIVAK